MLRRSLSIGLFYLWKKNTIISIIKSIPIAIYPINFYAGRISKELASWKGLISSVQGSVSGQHSKKVLKKSNNEQLVGLKNLTTPKKL